VLHEYIPPDPADDIPFSATTLDGDLPAAIQTPSGVATAPDPRRPPGNDRVYGESGVDDGPSATFSPDRDTRKPRVESYDDPFSPATAPFKRLMAFDFVGTDYTLGVRSRRLTPVQVGGGLGPGDETFYGDLTVDLIAGQSVRIPTVGPNSRLLRMHVNPEADAKIEHDAADNWFIRGSTAQRVRLVVQLAIARATFGSDFGDPDWRDLERNFTPDVTHQKSFAEVAQAIGISRAMRPRDVLRVMVEYFRSFSPSDEVPRGRDDIYLDLALSRKGVCRHRSFAFLVTALHIGLPARMVVNEAHAWVEVFDATLWHRIDLGGASENLQNDSDPRAPPYIPPPDPYQWPANRDSGQDMADRARNESQRPDAQDAGANSSPSSSDPLANFPPAPVPAPAPPSGEPPSEVVVTAYDRDVRRGLPFHLQGRVEDSGNPCSHTRVDVVLISPSFPQGATIGSLSTDDRGRYDGAVVIPRDFALGDYDVTITTPGDAHCRPGKTP
jgi:hypothetical protein